jgi:hypothetical protein
MGGMISLSTKEGHVSFVINLEVAESAGLKISAKLLSIAGDFKNDTEEP